MFAPTRLRFTRRGATTGLLFSVGVFVVVTVCGFTVFAQSQSSGSPNARRGEPQKDRSEIVIREQPRNPELSRQQAIAFNKGGLKAAAAIGGSAIRSVPVVFPNGGPNGVNQVLAESSFVGVGIVESNASRLSEDGRDIMLEYKVRITHTLKGQHPSQVLTVVIPGGRVSFQDGTWAQLNTPGLIWPLPGQEYLWCLRRSKLDRYAQLGRKHQDGLLHEPVQGPLGIYAISGPFVKPNGGPRTKIANALLTARMSREAFLESVSEALR